MPQVKRLLPPPESYPPAAWRAARRGTVPALLGGLLFLGGAIFLSVRASVALSNSQTTVGAMAVCGAVACVAVAVASAISALQRKFGLAGGVGPTAAGVSFRASPLILPVLILLPTATTAGFWWTWHTLRNGHTITDPGSAFPAALGAVVAGILTLEYLRGGFRPARIVLSPQGIRCRETTAETTVPWGAVLEIKPGTVGTGARTAPTVNILFSSKFPGIQLRRFSPLGKLVGEGTWTSQEERSLISVRPESFAIGAPRVLFALQFYFDHPEAREELSKEVAVDRIRALQG